MAMSNQDKNDAVINAVAHPIRRAILRELNGGVTSPSEIAEKIGEKLPNVSYHIRQLDALSIIKLVKTEPRRGAIEHFYKRAGTHLDRKVTEMLKHIGKD